jgi:hypothetical protein
MQLLVETCLDTLLSTFNVMGATELEFKMGDYDCVTKTFSSGVTKDDFESMLLSLDAHPEWITVDPLRSSQTKGRKSSMGRQLVRSSSGWMCSSDYFLSGGRRVSKNYKHTMEMEPSVSQCTNQLVPVSIGVIAKHKITSRVIRVPSCRYDLRCSYSKEDLILGPKKKSAIEATATEVRWTRHKLRRSFICTAAGVQIDLSIVRQGDADVQYEIEVECLRVVSGQATPSGNTVQLMTTLSRLLGSGDDCIAAMELI